MTASLTGRLILVRHQPVTRRWKERCYGRNDIGLSREGHAMLAPLVKQLAAMKPEHVIHSGLRRAHILATPLAVQLGVSAMTGSAWRERDFGTWEGRGWQSI